MQGTISFDTPGPTGKPAPLLALRGVKDLDSEAAKARAKEELVASPPVSRLAAFLDDKWREAEDHFDQHYRPRLDACRRAFGGEYAPDVLAKIREIGGSETYFNITRTKIIALTSWIEDILFGGNDKLWALRPTPLPDLPHAVGQRIAALVAAEFTAAARGQEGGAGGVEGLFNLFESAYDRAVEERQELAKQRAGRHDRFIEDQFVEGGFYDALRDAVSHLGVYPIAILKVPEVRRVRRMRWDDQVEEVVFEDKDVPSYKSVDPYDFYPSPNSTHVNDGCVFERGRIEPRALEMMIGSTGWNETAIRAALDEYIQGSLDDQAPDTPPSRGAAPKRGAHEGSAIEYLEYWGTLPVAALEEWGMAVSEEDKRRLFIECRAIKIGRWIVHAIKNPDPEDRKPYLVTSYEKSPGQIYGRAPAEVMRDCQDAYNAALRNLQNNMAWASGPMAAIDKDGFDPDEDPTDIHPWKVIAFHGNNVLGRQNPIIFFQPESNAGQLLHIAEYFAQQADDRTLIPRFAHANPDVGGAGQTSSGLKMLMDAGFRGLKRVLGNIDQDWIRPAVARQWAWNMLYVDNMAIKCDASVWPQGVLASLMREQLKVRQNEALAITNNPVDVGILGVENRAKMLKQMLNNLGFHDIVPDAQEIRRRAGAPPGAAPAAENENNAPA